MRAGQLSDRLEFWARPPADDGGGNTEGPFAFQFAEWAELRLRQGNEAVAAARIEGRLPVEVRVRRNARTMLITTGWMARDARGVEYNVQAPAPDPRDRGAVVFTMVAGGVLG